MSALRGAIRTIRSHEFTHGMYTCLPAALAYTPWKLGYVSFTIPFPKGVVEVGNLIRRASSSASSLMPYLGANPSTMINGCLAVYKRRSRSSIAAFSVPSSFSSIGIESFISAPVSPQKPSPKQGPSAILYKPAYAAAETLSASHPPSRPQPRHHPNSPAHK